MRRRGNSPLWMTAIWRRPLKAEKPSHECGIEGDQASLLHLCSLDVEDWVAANGRMLLRLLTFRKSLSLFSAALLLLELTGCNSVLRSGALEKRTGDEIVVAGQMFHTGSRVVTWMDPGGYDA